MRINKDSELFVSYNTIIKLAEQQDYGQLLRYCMLKNIVVGLGEPGNEVIIFHPKGYIFDYNESVFSVLKLKDGMLMFENDQIKQTSCYMMYLTYKNRLDFSFQPGNKFIINYR